MHVVTNRSWILLFGTLFIISALGCRGSRPFGSMVKVTAEPTTDMSDIDAPQQRLAIASPRSSALKPNADANSAPPDVSNNAALAAETDFKSSSRRDQTAAKRSISSLPVNVPADDHATPKSEQNARFANNEAPADVVAGSQIAAIELPAGDAEALMLAFKDYPPEVQQEALRRLVATTARTAERSSQPESITEQLKAQSKDLPELPETSEGDPHAPPPQRIASNDPAPSSSAVSAARSAGPSRTSVNESVQSRLTDLPTSDLQPAAAAFNDKVQPAIVASGADETVVAQASVEREMEYPGDPAPVVDPLPADSAVPLSDVELFSQLVQKLAVAPDGESEADRASRLIKLRHLMVLSGDPDSAVEQIDGMNESEQEYLRHQLLGLWTMIDPQGHPVPSRRFSTAIPQIREAAKFAAAATDSLEVRSLAFCTEIEAYGQVKPFQSNRFDPGQQVILYCEIENFTAVKHEDGYETHLQGSYDLFNEKDEKVVSQLLPADQQTSANYLRDYFIAYQMHLPEQLAKGKYRLQLTMEDVQGKKYGQASIPLEIKK